MMSSSFYPGQSPHPTWPSVHPFPPEDARPGRFDTGRAHLELRSPTKPAFDLFRGKVRSSELSDVGLSNNSGEMRERMKRCRGPETGLGTRESRAPAFRVRELSRDARCPSGDPVARWGGVPGVSQRSGAARPGRARVRFQARARRRRHGTEPGQAGATLPALPRRGSTYAMGSRAERAR